MEKARATTGSAGAAQPQQGTSTQHGRQGGVLRRSACGARATSARALVARSAASSLPAEEGGAAASAAKRAALGFARAELLPLC
eukprot:COSAG02_NODE_2517_length_8617_cov_4.605893_2_plen_84_part_00